MRPAAPQWQMIGGALGFLDSDLTIIQNSPMLIPEGPTGYFRQMLSQWLKWAPPNHRWPTLEALETALRSSGHEKLAFQLRSLFFLKQKGMKGSASFVIMYSLFLQMRVTTALVSDPVGRLIQLLHASQIWDQWMWTLCPNKGQCLMVATIRRNYRSTDDEVL